MQARSEYQREQNKMNMKITREKNAGISINLESFLSIHFLFYVTTKTSKYEDVH